MIKRIGVIGAGQMGSSIAHVCALAGYDVVVHDLSEDRLKSSLATIHGNMARQVAKQAISEEARQAALKRISPAERLDALGQDMVRASVERAGTSPQARWKRMEKIISEPTLPGDLTR